MNKTANRLAIVVFPVFLASVLVTGSGRGDEPTESVIAPSHDTFARTVGTVKAPDGVDIVYEVAGSGEPTLVFVHGWSCDRSYWRAQTDHFAASHRVVAVDLGGHGDSGLGRKDWTMNAFGGDVRAVVEALALRKVVLVGHSMGGHVIVEATQLLPDRVAALVLVDTFDNVDQRQSAEDLERFLAPMRADFRGTTEVWVRRRLFAGGSDPRLAERIARDMAAAPAAVGLSAMQHVRSYDEGVALAAVRVPVRMINADLFPTNLEAARRRKPDVSLAVMPAVGHFPMMEDPDEFNRLLARAVKQLPATR
jgi:pimeloyl-ACP methyl ester carboxylesterase